MRIVILGAGGRLGAALLRQYEKSFDVCAFNRAELDLSNSAQVRERLSAREFDVLINCAALTNVDLCESKPDEAFAINAEAPGLLAKICSEKRTKLIHFSTDYVFDGRNRQPYSEDDVAEPISVYGKSKRTGEKAVLETSDRHVVVRVSWVFGPDRPSFIDAMINRAREETAIDAVADKWSTPSYTADVGEMLPRIFELEAGIVHLVNSGECTWQEYAQHALDCCRGLGIPL